MIHRTYRILNSTRNITLTLAHSSIKGHKNNPDPGLFHGLACTHATLASGQLKKQTAKDVSTKPTNPSYTYYKLRAKLSVSTFFLPMTPCAFSLIGLQTDRPVKTRDRSFCDSRCLNSLFWLFNSPFLECAKS
jgi:hypothetical protein